MTVTVRIKNPPYKGNYWQLVLYNEVWGDSVMAGTHIPIDQPITLEALPAGWAFPLYIHIMVYENPVSPHNVIYQVQSAYGPDWLYYKNITIPNHGSYEYDVATEQLELVEPVNDIGGNGVLLKAGWNYVVYTGKVQTVATAFASIASYVTAFYYYNNYTGRYEFPTTMVPYGVYNIYVTQNCTWTYGAEATAPSSVQLYSEANLVAYSGPEQLLEDALASIWNYLTNNLEYYDNTAKEWVTVFPSYTMVPNTPYKVEVDRDCVWTFVAPIKITAPDSAEEGATVPVSVKVTNTLDIGYRFKTEIFAVPDAYPHYLIFSAEETIYGGASKTYDTSFTMPDCNTTVYVSVEREGAWYAVDGKVVNLKIPEPEPIEGTIIKKELEYSGSGDGTVPVIGVPQGVSAKLHVWGRNDMSISQGMGIYWFVADPDGEIAEEYEDWGGTIGAYPTDHEFISSGSFDLNKIGKYTTWIKLLMGSEDDPEIVDQYIGDLCTVVAELVPTFSELKISSFEKR